MKNIVLASLLGFGLISSAGPLKLVNIHDRVNNAQAPCSPDAVFRCGSCRDRGDCSRMTGMDQHEQAIIAHVRP